MLADAMGLYPHSMCLLADPAVLWTLVATDLITAVAYFVIPASLGPLSTKQSAAAQARTRLIQIFVVACGCSHVMMAVVIFQGGAAYYLQAGVNLVMAAASIATALVFWQARSRMPSV